MTARLALVIWEDAVLVQGLPLAELNKETNYLCESKSVGYVLRRGDSIVVIQTIQDVNDKATADILFVPKKWVKKIIYLEEAKNGGEGKANEKA
jgi:hypothetical protein